MKFQGIFVILFISIGMVAFSSFSIFHQNADVITFVVTVASKDAATPVRFNIAMNEDKGEMYNDFKMLENQRTPFKITLKNANYLIVVHKTSDEATITGQVEKMSNGESRASASTEGEVMVFTTEKDGKVTCFGMD